MPPDAVDLQELAASARDGLQAAADEAALEAWRVVYLGRKGRLTLVLRSLGELPIEERKRLGAEANRLREELEVALDAKRSDLQDSGFALDRTNAENRRTLRWGLRLVRRIVQMPLGLRLSHCECFVFHCG